MADLHRHGYAVAEFVLADSACERIVEALPASDLLQHPTVVAMTGRLATLFEEPGLVLAKAMVVEETSGQWQQAAAATVRVQLDRGGGSARIIPSSHRRPMEQSIEEGPVAELALPQGAILLLRAGAVHAALRGRVLHLELGV